MYLLLFGIVDLRLSRINGAQGAIGSKAGGHGELAGERRRYPIHSSK